MALVSSRIVLSSDLSGQQQVYISSGLGGHDKKLRFSPFYHRIDNQFSELQKEIVEREFMFQLQKADVVIERFEIKENYFTILMLFPFDKDVKSSLNAAVAECNEYGNFLDPRFLFTNVKVLSEKKLFNYSRKNNLSVPSNISGTLMLSACKNTFSRLSSPLRARCSPCLAVHRIFPSSPLSLTTQRVFIRQATKTGPLHKEATA